MTDDGGNTQQTRVDQQRRNGQDADVEPHRVHLLPAGELFEQGYPNTSIAVCGEPVTSEPDGDEVNPSYCPECVSAALRWNARPGWSRDPRE